MKPRHVSESSGRRRWTAHLVQPREKSTSRREKEEDEPVEKKKEVKLESAAERPSDSSQLRSNQKKGEKKGLFAPRKEEEPKHEIRRR